MKTIEDLVYFAAYMTSSGKEIVGIETYTVLELGALAKCIMTLSEDSCVVEIGTFAGRSASLYLQLQEELNLDIHLIDNCMWHPEASGSAFNGMINTYFWGRCCSTIYNSKS